MTKQLLNRFSNIILTTIYFILLLLILPFPVYAIAAPHCQGNFAGFVCLEDIYMNILHIAIGGASIGSFIMILAGGFSWLTSGGDPKALEKARDQITYGIAGLVIMILAWFILKFISEFSLGSGTTDILKFQIPQ